MFTVRCHGGVVACHHVLLTIGGGVEAGLVAGPPAARTRSQRHHPAVGDGGEDDGRGGNVTRDWSLGGQ